MKKAIVLYILGMIGVFKSCIYLMTNGKVPIFDTTNNIIYNTTYLETGSAIALLVGLFAFLTSIFINYYTSEKNKENILMQLKHKDEKKSLIKLRIMLNELDYRNNQNNSMGTASQITELHRLESQNNVENGFYEKFIEIFKKFKKSDDYYNYYSLPKKFKDILDSTISKNYEFKYNNIDRENYFKNLDNLQNMINDELNEKY